MLTTMKKLFALVAALAVAFLFSADVSAAESNFNWGPPPGVGGGGPAGSDGIYVAKWGSDAFGTGAIDNPYFTVGNAILQKVGTPANAAGYLTGKTIVVLGPGTFTENITFTTRVFIKLMLMDGAFLNGTVTYVVRNADRFGETEFPLLSIIGAGVGNSDFADNFDSGRVGNGTNSVRVDGDAADLVAFVDLRFVSVWTDGVVDSDGTVGMGGYVRAQNCYMSGVTHSINWGRTAGAGTGVWVIDSFHNLYEDQLRVELIQEDDGSAYLGNITVDSSADPGIANGYFQGVQTWTGPAGSATIDTFSNGSFQNWTLGGAATKALREFDVDVTWPLGGGEDGLTFTGGDVTVQRDSLAVTSTDGVAVVNTTAATGGVTAQYSPRFRFRGNAWTGAASNTEQAYIELRTVSGATTSGRIMMAFAANGAGAFTDRFLFTSAGAVQITGDTTSNGQFFFDNGANSVINFNSSTHRIGPGLNTENSTGFIILTTASAANGGVSVYSAGDAAADHPGLRVGTSATTAGANTGFRLIEGCVDMGGVVADCGFVVTAGGTVSVASPLNGSTPELRLYEDLANGTNYRGFKSAASTAADLVYEVPAAPTSNGQVLTSTTAGVMSWGVKITKGSLADGTSGWVPDGAATAFTVTADAASVTATAFIGVSVAANGTAGATCAVRTVTAATSFVVNCAVAPANGATLQYGIFD